MSTPFSGVHAVQQNGYATTSDEAWVNCDCVSCGPGVQMARVAYRQQTPSLGAAHWLICASCKRAYLLTDDRLYPSATGIGTPEYLPAPTGEAWAEVVACLDGDAHTSAAIMCRKILLHVAIENGLEAPGTRSPTFIEATNYLEAQNIVTPMMRPWLDHIRNSGNAAAHELQSTARDEALELAEFTKQLLVLVYEMPGRIAARAKPEGGV